MNRANVKLILFSCALSAGLIWLFGYSLHFRPTPREESLRQRYLALCDYDKTNGAAVHHQEFKQLAAQDITNADSETRRLALDLSSRLSRDRDDEIAAEQSLLHQSWAAAAERHARQSRFTHVAEAFAGAAFLLSLLLFATAPKPGT